MAHVIGITGLAGSGKDTLARAMQYWFRHYGERSCIAGFATLIREVCKATGLLDPYNRGTKEVPVTISRDLFCDSLQHAIDTVLRPHLSQEGRDKLYNLMVRHTQQFTSHPVGSSYTEYMNISPRQFMQVLGTEAGQHVTTPTMWVDLVQQEWARMRGVVLVTDYRFAHETQALDKIIVVIRPGTVRVNAHVSEDLAEKLTNDRPGYFEDVSVGYLYNSGSEVFLQREIARDIVVMTPRR